MSDTSSCGVLVPIYWVERPGGEHPLDGWETYEPAGEPCWWVEADPPWEWDAECDCLYHPEHGEYWASEALVDAALGQNGLRMAGCPPLPGGPNP